MVLAMAMCVTSCLRSTFEADTDWRDDVRSATVLQKVSPGLMQVLEESAYRCASIGRV